MTSRENDLYSRNNHAIFLKHKSKMTGDCCVFKLLLRSARKTFDAFLEWNLRFQIPPT